MEKKIMNATDFMYHNHHVVGLGVTNLMQAYADYVLENQTPTCAKSSQVDNEVKTIKSEYIDGVKEGLQIAMDIIGKHMVEEKKPYIPFELSPDLKKAIEDTKKMINSQTFKKQK